MHLSTLKIFRDDPEVWQRVTIDRNSGMSEKSRKNMNIKSLMDIHVLYIFTHIPKILHFYQIKYKWYKSDELKLCLLMS